MKEARAKLMHDHAVVGEGVPMITASGADVHVNDIVYTVNANPDPYRDKPSFEFTAWRVIQINYKERYYRIRCGEGCEQSIHHSDGCPKMKVFHVFEDAQVHGADLFREEKDSKEAKILEIQKDIEELEWTRNDLLSAAVPKAPPPIALEGDTQ